MTTVAGFPAAIGPQLMLLAFAVVVLVVPWLMTRPERTDRREEGDGPANPATDGASRSAPAAPSQALLPGRTYDLHDVAFNTAFGALAIAATALVAWARRWDGLRQLRGGA